MRCWLPCIRKIIEQHENFRTNSTVYRYDYQVYLEPHTFRLRPRTNSAQLLLTFEIQIVPAPAGTAECLDQDGNLALHAWLDSLARELSELSRFSVGMLRENPFDFVLTGESLNLPLWYLEPWCADLAPYQNDVHVAEAVKQYAKEERIPLEERTEQRILIFFGWLHENRPDLTPVGNG